VRNRQTWTVAAVTTDGALYVTHPERGRAMLPVDYVRQHVELGWAVTGYGNQGDTVDVSIAVLEPGTTRNHAYVALTRGRHTNLAMLVDASGVDQPSDALANITRRSPKPESALAMLEHLSGEEGCLQPDATAVKLHQRANRVAEQRRGGGLGL
jgi:ATP-dependent exoDNAse (exonuclease V) alpha subunit